MEQLEILDIPIQSESVKPVLVKGDTIDAVVIESETFPNLTTSTVDIEIYNYKNKLLDFTNGSGITIDSATQFTIDEISKENNILPEGTSIGDVRITDANGKRKTYLRIRYTVLKESPL